MLKWIVSISEIISNQNVGLIHCQPTLNGGCIFTEIYCMNGKNIKAVDINKFQIRPCAYQKWMHFLFWNSCSTPRYLERKVLLESFWYFLHILEGQNPNGTIVKESFGLSLLRMKAKLQFCKYVGPRWTHVQLHLFSWRKLYFSESRPTSAKYNLFLCNWVPCELVSVGYLMRE